MIPSSHYNNDQIDELLSEGDFNGDGVVDFDDVVLYSPYSGANLQRVWLLADLNSDYGVDDLDAAILANHMEMSNAAWADGNLDDDNAITLADLDLMSAQNGLDLAVAS